MKKAFGLSKVHPDHNKGLNVAIVKATSYECVLPKAKHVQTIFRSLSPSKPHYEVIYCIDSLSRRLRQTNNSVVALKTLIIIHRAMRELDNTVSKELENYSRGRGYLINLTHFRDTLTPYALADSDWIGNYGLYLEERLRCYALVNYDIGIFNSKVSRKHDTKDLLDQLLALQNLLFRLLDCKPVGSSVYNRLIQYALSMVVGESIKLYVAITIRVVELLDKFFEMNRSDAASALEIYRKLGSQAERLSEFFETCRGLDFGRGQKFINIKKPPGSFITTMEEYIKDAPTTLMLEYNEDVDEKGGTSNENGTLNGDLLIEVAEDTNLKDTLNPSIQQNENTTPPQAAEIMGLCDLLTGASEFDENSLALAIIPTDNDGNGASSVTGWEVALFSEPESSNDNLVSESEEATSLDVILNDEANVGAQYNGTYNIGQVSSNPFDFEANIDSQNNVALAPTTSTFHNAYYAYPNMVASIPSQMLSISSQDYYMMQQQQEPSIANKKSSNPFDAPDMLPKHMPSNPNGVNHSCETE